MFKKKLGTLDVVDSLWEIFWNAVQTKDSMPDISITEWAEDIFSDIPMQSKWTLEYGIKSFGFELEFLYKPPVRTMEHFYGEHVMLYDVFGCKKHRVLVTSYDDSRIVWNSTLLCPICNENMIISNKEYPLEWRQIETDEEWNTHLKWARNHRKDVLWSNFTYRLKKLFDVKYQIRKIKWKIKRYKKSNEM